jgi:16S rRNA (uracil1498-N3)-methyltransferase
VKFRRLTAPSTPTPPPAGELIALDPAESHHGFSVLRLKPNTSLELTGPWGLAPALVEKIDIGPPLIMWVRLTGAFTAPDDSGQGPDLGLALIKGPRFDWAVEKAAELGVRRLFPLNTHRTQALGSGEPKKARWTRLAQQARKQCGRPLPMIVSEPVPLRQWLNSELAFPRFVLDPQGALFPLELCLEATLLVGPEGGFTEEEKALAKGQGFESVSLGPIALRSETAAIASLALLARLGLGQGLNKA